MATEARWTTWFEGGKERATQVVDELLHDEVVLEQITSKEVDALRALHNALERARFDGQVGTVSRSDVLVTLSMVDLADLDALLLDVISGTPGRLSPERLHELRDRLPIPGAHRSFVPPEPPEPKAPVTRSELLTEANRIIGGDRAETYGDARESFNRIGLLWGDLLGQTVSATDVARMMVLMKVSRLHLHPDHADSWLDIAGYAALGAEIAEAKL